MLDFHTHHLDASPPAIISLPARLLLGQAPLPLRAGIGYAVGIHPWETEHHSLEALSPLWEAVTERATASSVVMIGETGLDALRGNMEVQLSLFEQHALLAERVGKPMVIHNVRATHHLLALRRRLRPSQRWIVHGFRGKPAQAQQLLDTGFDLSFGYHCHPATLQACPLHRLHLETDDGVHSLSTVYAHLQTLRPSLANKDFSQEIETFLPKHFGI